MPFTVVADWSPLTPMQGGGTSAAVIVEPHLTDALVAIDALSNAGFHVTVAESFADARAIVSSRRPAVLITELRLGDYNGLHLVMRAKALRPDTAAIVTSRTADVVLVQQAEQLGATFVAKPSTAREFLAAVARTIVSARDGGEAIRPPFERRLQERRIRVMGELDMPERRHTSRRQPLAAAIASAAPGKPLP